MVINDVAVAAKKAARAQLNKALKALTTRQIQTESEAVFKTIIEFDWYHSAKNIGIYLSFPLELSTTALLNDLLARQAKQGTRIFVPHMSDTKNSIMTMLEIRSSEDLANNFVPNKWGILEPKEEAIADRADVLRDNISLQLILMPGLGFDKNCRRLGRGKGYYDRFLNTLKTKSSTKSCAGTSDVPRPTPCFPLLVGLSLKTQVMEEIPVSEKDVPLDYVVTADNVFCADSQRAKKAKVSKIDETPTEKS